MAWAVVESPVFASDKRTASVELNRAEEQALMLLVVGISIVQRGDQTILGQAYAARQEEGELTHTLSSYDCYRRLLLAAVAQLLPSAACWDLIS